ncbi:MAG: tRNA pseudouridine(38-40) synthase TruA [Candidatus Marinimicrobia bacterium]|nr:tRNA pseudouridine(38-40) synthase TruA [Candidatus Neomarinimicrobiota bacterium]
MRIALLIQYDGSNYHGWQVQPDPLTIQGFIEQALGIVFEGSCGLVGSGRTDSGVHALGQVAHFDIESTPIPIQNIWKVLNRQLPDDIRVINSCEVADDFHSRFQAVKREYQYTIGLQQQVLHRNSRWLVRYPLDRNKLHQVSELIVGEHDFSSFCYAGTETENMICNIVEATWAESADTSFIFQVKADRFLHHMVRMLVGSMIEVSRAKWDLQHFADLLNRPDRQAQVVTAPANGLALMRVHYPVNSQPVWEHSRS